MVTVYLKKGRERSVLQGNPWIFSGAIGRFSESAYAGAPCIVRAFDGNLLGCGYCNPASAITVRVLAWGKEGFGDSDVAQAVRRAVDLRRSCLDGSTDSCRLVNSEGDFLPGLVVDKFGDGLVVQFLTAGMERMKDSIIGTLVSHCSPRFIHERSDTESRIREGIGEAEGPVYGDVPGEVVIRENGHLFGVDIAKGQKTGFFFDQRDNRFLLGMCSAGRHICDCFCYNGPFTVYGLAGGAAYGDAVDLWAAALGNLRRNVELNGLDASKVKTATADVFSYLREIDDRYDCIILDPPKFARHPGEVERASRGYKAINLLACKKIAPGGLIFTFSCWNAIDMKLFRQIVFGAAADSGRRFQLLHTLTAGPDHPVNLAHKEGDYLKGLVLRAQ